MPPILFAGLYSVAFANLQNSSHQPGKASRFGCLSTPITPAGIGRLRPIQARLFEVLVSRSLAQGSHSQQTMAGVDHLLACRFSWLRRSIAE
jgi:hypothetical protein